jgi:hypothetical protein
MRPAATLLPVKRATKCPGCGEPVSVFAAGCAICGTDLVEHRREIEARRVELPQVQRATRRLRFDPHLALVALVLLATLLSLFVALAGVNLALAFLPTLRFGLYSLLF